MTLFEEARELSLLLRSQNHLGAAGVVDALADELEQAQRMVVDVTGDERERAVTWAQHRIEQGHHRLCDSRMGGACDCYFRQGEYQAARIVAALRAAEPEEPQP